jgi:hypothetical protein
MWRHFLLDLQASALLRPGQKSIFNFPQCLGWICDTPSGRQDQVSTGDYLAPKTIEVHGRLCNAECQRAASIGPGGFD